MRREDQRFLGWLIAIIMAMIFLLWQAVGCVQVRVVTGEGNEYEGSTKEQTGIETNLSDGDTLVRDINVPEP